MAASLKVLLVEDNASDAELICIHLQRNGFSLESARVETAAAMEKALKSQCWDVVIADFSLPAFSAPDALVLLQKRGLGTPFILLSNSADEPAALELLQAGACDYLTKDNLARLAAVVRREQTLAQARQSRPRSQVTPVEPALGKSSEHFLRLAENAPDVIFRYELHPVRRLSYINPAVQTVTGYSPQECYADPELIFRWVHPDDQEKMTALGATNASVVMRWNGKDGLARWMEIRATRVDDESGQWTSIEGSARDISEQRAIESTQSFLAQHGWVAAGEDFFNALARFLAEILEMDYVCIDRLEENNLAATTVAVYFDGHFEDNVTYTLKDTPCGDVVAKSVCCFPHKVRHLFPRDAVLQEMVAESYIGTTLWDSYGELIGLIAVIGRKHLAKPALAETILKLVSMRAAGELERRKAETALRISQDRFTQAMEATNDGLWDWDVLTGEAYFSPGYWRMLGYAPTELPGQYETWAHLLHPDDRERAVEASQSCVENRSQNFSVEFRMLARGGQWKWIFARGKVTRRDAAGRALRMVGTHVDISERKQADQALRESEARFSNAFQHAPIGMALVSLEGRWLKVNRRLCDLLGYSQEELLELTFQDVTLPADLESDLRFLDEMLRGEIQTYQMEKRYLHRLGHIVWVHLSVSLVRDDKEKPLYLISQIQDVTRRKEAEAQIQEQIDELRRWHAVTLGREDRVQELKREINRLLAEEGMPPRYASEGNGADHPVSG